MDEGLPLRQIIKYFIYGIATIIVISLIYFWASHGMATITVVKNDGIAEEQTIKSIDANGEESDVFRIGTLYFIPRSAKSIQAAAGSYATLQGIDKLPYFGITNFSIALYKDRDPDKVVSDAPGCLSYRSVTAQITSYDCSSPSFLLTFDPTSWQNREIAGIAGNTFAIAPYQGGVIGIELGQETDSPVFITDAAGNSSYIKKPAALTSDELDSASVITSHTSNDSHFIIKTRSGALYYGDKDGTYIKYDAPAQYNKDFDTMLCSLGEKRIYCYYGPSSDSGDSEDATKHRKENSVGYLETIDMSAKERKSAPLDGEGIDAIAVTRNGHIYGRTQDKLYSLQESGKAPRRVMLATDVTSLVADQSLYFAKGSSLYKTDGLQSHRVFFSENIRLSSVFVIDNTILFNAYFAQTPAGSEEAVLHTFQLTDKIHSNNSKRLVDIAPLSLGTSVIGSDYYKNTIRLQIYASIISDRETGTTTVDDAEYAANKTAALQKLQALGINPENYSIEFTY